MAQPLTCSWKEYNCEVLAKKEGYCLKHHARGVLLEEAKKKGVRICDDGKRKCRNETFNNKLKCEECLKSTREKEMVQYNERKEKGLCTMCGKEMEKLTTGIKDHNLQKCQDCYATMRKVEDKRVRDRNYAVEKKLNPSMHYREYTLSAVKKNVEFRITLEEFSDIVTKPCYYCKTYKETEVIGIDRIDSLKGYAVGNIVPACQVCNMMKNNLTTKEFIDHIELLYKNFVSTFKDESVESDESPPSYRLRPNKIVDLYIKRKLNTYIDMCRADNRSQLFIKKLVDATQYTMSTVDFRKSLVYALRVDLRSKELTDVGERKRIPREEMYSLLKLNKPIEVVKLYEAVFGPTKDIRNDMQELALVWNTREDSVNKQAFDSLILKYNNMRAYKKRKGDDKSEENQTIESYDEETETISKKEEETPLTQEPTQWKVSNIIKHFQNNTEYLYKAYLDEKHSSYPDWETKWTTFRDSVKAEEHPESLVKEFILSLRTLRHNALCYANSKVLDREDRQIWKNDTVLRAFKEKKLDKFKEFTETNTGDKPSDPIWTKRWDTFVDSVNKETDDSKKKTLISKFLTAQRTKKFRRSEAVIPVK
jgi:hypothetical protein